MMPERTHTDTTRHTRPLQKDVAARAGVSRTTVSLVLNNVPGAAIPEETRARVFAAARELGLALDTARCARGTRSNVIGFLTSEVATTPYAVEIIKGVQDQAFERRQTLLIIDTDGSEQAAEDALTRLSEWRADGLVLAADHHRRVDLPPGLGRLPTVLVNCFADAALNSILPDEVQGGQVATDTLLAVGHQRVGFINGPASWPASRGRLAGYLEAHRTAGIPVDRTLIRNGDWWQESAARHTAGLMALPDPPTAIFCGNDWMAMGCYDVLRERGLRIPQDISVIGFDNRVEIADHMHPRLTTVALPYREMGRYSVRLTLSADRAKCHGSRHLIACPLIERDSVTTPHGGPHRPSW